MWQAEWEVPGDGRARRLCLRGPGGTLSFAAVLSGWRGDAGFRGFFSDLLAAAPFPAWYWELPPLTRAGLDAGFECVLLDAPELAGLQADPRAFAGHCRAGAPVADFANLGGDAWLVVPCPGGADAGHAHLAAFLRRAPDDRRQALWERVGHCAAARLSARPLWISTAGLGVAWLHVRLDSTPKYYRWRPYRQAGGARG